MTFLAIVLSILSGSVSAALAAYLGWRNLLGLENEKVARGRNATGVLLQAELALFYRDLADHNRKVKGYAGQVYGQVDALLARQFPSFLIDREQFPIFYGSFSAIGLFDKDLTCRIVFCYSNMLEHGYLERKFIDDLGDLINSSELGRRADELWKRGDVLLIQIGDMIESLARASQAIPFSRAQA